MNIYILDKQFRTIYALDSFESFIWADRYQSYGDFEVFGFPNNDIFENMQLGNYVFNSDSEKLMIIESIRTETNLVEGDKVIVTGRSLESILERRIIWSQTVLNGNLQNEIIRLLNENIISPSITSRKIANFEVRRSSDPRITSLSVSAQYTGDNLYEVIETLCLYADIGFKVTLEGNTFVFQLYKGEDRSYNQETNPYVIFSPKFDNIINSKYIIDSETYRNVALIAGEGEGVNRRTVTIGSQTGLERRELFVDARDITSETADGTIIPDSQYNDLLKQRGTEKMAENILVTSFDAEVETSKTFVYGQDFNLGDTVQIENEYKLSGQSMISEIIWSYDRDSFSVYPTFVSVNK